METKVSLEDIVSLAKRRGFIFQGSEIYGGLAGTYDYGPLGAALKRNIRDAWLKFFVDGWDDMYLMDTAVLMNRKVWEASGHVGTFHDPLVECSDCHARFRADQVKDKCPNCGKENTFGESRKFDMMFRTFVGPTWSTAEFKDGVKVGGKFQSLDSAGKITNQIDIKDSTTGDSVAVYEKDSLTYLRPETAQGMFVNFKNILDSYQPDLPFGIAQVGKSFRNEISPRDWLFRTREFEIMEFEFFVNPADSEKYFEKWRGDMHGWFKHIGLPAEKIHEVEMPEADRAHYSKRTIDFEFDFPFGRAELSGLADRGDFDLKKHQEKSGVNMEYRPKNPPAGGGSVSFIPHVIEPTWGLDRHVFAVLANAYSEDVPAQTSAEVSAGEQGGDPSTSSGQEKRIFLKLPASLAPVKVAVFPLLKNKPELVSKAREVYEMLKKELGAVMWDDNGNIGKRYRRQDEIGTPHCITVDFDSLQDNTVTLRDRDTTEQVRIKIDELVSKL